MDRNQRNDDSKETKEEIKFVKKIQKVLNYSNTFEEKYNVEFLATKIHYIVEKMKYSK